MTMKSRMSEQPSAQGFTLIETLIAIAVLMLSIAGPLYIADRTLVVAATSRSQLVATYLAQEGVEYVRAMRDHEFLAAYQAGGTTISTAGWNAFVLGPGTGGSVASCESQVCTVDTSSNVLMSAALVPCPNGVCAPLYLSSGGFYSQQNLSGSTQTIYTRKVQVIVSQVNPNDVRTEATVSWALYGVNYHVTVTDHLTPWQ